ncbi:unnamed protein product [Arabidopsis halleri]
MAETLLYFGVQKLWDLLVRESDRFKGVDEQLTELKSNLNLLRSFLKDADAKKHASETVRNFVEEIKEISFDAEDIIETFLLKEELRKTSGIKMCMRRLSCFIVDRKEIASDIGGLSKRISKVIRDMQSFGVQQMIVDGNEYSHPLQERQRELRKTFPSNYENDLVGLEENVKLLVGYLVEEVSFQGGYYDGATIREVADGYIEELVKRNMVISGRDARTSRFETCHLHDMMREVCLLKAEEENFVHIVDKRLPTKSQSSCKSRRIAVHQLDETYHPKGENPKLRSLLFFSLVEGWMPSDLLFTRLQLLRALDLSRTQFEGGNLPSSIGKLIHLRYLSLYQAHVTHLPSSMRNLKQLLYLNLCVDARSLIYMPNFLKEMRELTYLSLPFLIHDKVKMELGNLVNLETLENFSTEHGSVRDLESMTQLRALSICIRGGCTVKTLSSSLRDLRHLENLTIYDFHVHAPTKDEEGFFFIFRSSPTPKLDTIYAKVT